MSILALYSFFVLLPNIKDYTSAGGIWVVLIIIFVISGIGLMAMTIGKSNGDSSATELCPQYSSVFKSTTITMIILSILNIFTPTQNQLYMITGGYVATNNEELKKLPNNVLKAANNYLDKLNNSLEQSQAEKDKANAK